MRTIQEALAELRELAQRAQQGEDVGSRTGEVARELRAHGVEGLALQRAFPIGTPEHDLLANSRSGSQFIGSNGDRETARLQAAQRGLPSAAHVVQPSRFQGGSGGLRGVDVLFAVRDAKAGDYRAAQQLGAMSKGMVGGSFLIAEDVLPGYIEARTAAGPVRALCTEHNVTGRQVRLIVEGDGDLTIESVPEGAQKPMSEAAVEQIISTIHKAAGVTELPDELVDDSQGLAEAIVASKFGKSVGKKIDRDLLDGTGTGQPLGVLRHPDVADTPVAGQTAMQVYRSIIAALNRVSLRYYDNLSVVLHPAVLERFELATDANGQFLFGEGGLQAKLVGKARVVPDANLPVNGTDNTVPLIVGDFRQLHFFSRQALSIESSEGPGFVTDETTYRAVERYGAALIKPEAMEVVTGVDLDHVEGAA